MKDVFSKQPPFHYESNFIQTRNEIKLIVSSSCTSNLDTFFIREISVKTRNQNIFLIRASHSVHNKQRQQHLHGTIFQLRLIGPSKKSISSGALPLSLSLSPTATLSRSICSSLLQQPFLSKRE